MSAHTSKEIRTCIEIALRCVETDRVKRPTISEILDELNKFDTSTVNELNKVNMSNSSAMAQVHTILVHVVICKSTVPAQCS